MLSPGAAICARRALKFNADALPSTYEACLAVEEAKLLQGRTNPNKCTKRFVAKLARTRAGARSVTRATCTPSARCGKPGSDGRPILCTLGDHIGRRAGDELLPVEKLFVALLLTLCSW